MSATAGSGRARTIQPTDGTRQHARPFQTFAHPLKARLLDTADGTPVADVPVTFGWDSTTQQVLFEGEESAVIVRTDSHGYAQTPPLVAGDAAGTATFVVTAEGATPEQFEVTVDG